MHVLDSVVSGAECIGAYGFLALGLGFRSSRFLSLRFGSWAGGFELGGFRGRKILGYKSVREQLLGPRIPCLCCQNSQKMLRQVILLSVSKDPPVPGEGTNYYKHTHATRMHLPKARIPSYDAMIKIQKRLWLVNN